MQLQLASPYVDNLTIFKIPAWKFHSIRKKYAISLIFLLSFVFKIFNFEINKPFAGHPVFSNY